MTDRTKVSQPKILVALWAVVYVLCFCGAATPAFSEDDDNRQVRIEVKALEWTVDNSLDYGFTVTYTRDDDSGAIIESGDLTLPSQASVDLGIRMFLKNMNMDGGSFEFVIEALEQVGDVAVLSEPNIICRVSDLSGSKEPYSSMVKTVSKVPYEAAQPVGVTLAEVTRFRDVGVTLNVGIRRIIADEYVLMDIQTMVTNLAGYIAVGKNREGDPMSVPEIYTRKIENTLLVPNQNILISGVLKTTSTVVKETGVPWISQIPVLGFFFKNRSEEEKSHELLFLIRPEILETNTL